jgi:cytochrome oxidase Cu insertion factor (SCO1/SenC/PrrC family)
MPGMNAGLNTNNPTVVSAFKTALVHQALIVLLILALVAVAWNVLRSVQLRRTMAAGAGGTAGNAGTAGVTVSGAAAAFAPPEAPARRLVRISFGLLWILDGILQAQVSMPLGLVRNTIQPSAATSPGWVRDLVNDGTRIWNYHPIPAATASVWIQVGIGVALLVAPRGTWSRLAGLAGVGWGLVVWIFGEAFGGIFAPGLSWMFGAPGAVLFYCVAGALVALPERFWTTPRLGRIILRLTGAFFLGMALLQAWPGRGFWQGQAIPRATPGTVTAMVGQMAQTPQPTVLSSLVRDFATFDAAHGWGVNLFVVVALAVVGAGLVSARAALVRGALVVAVVIGVADWIFVQDLGFVGGTGTDPNSMIPILLIAVTGYLALTRIPAVDGDRVVAITDAAGARPGWRQRVLANPTYAFRSVAALGAFAIVLVGAVPMAAAAANPNADPILTQAVNGTTNVTNAPAPAFHLVDQRDRPVSLASLRGKTIGLTFLDPVCVSDCPLIAQEFRAADGMLGGAGAHVVLIAIDANPLYTQPDALRAFDQQEGLDHLANWLYLTGSLAQLNQVWNAYGVQVAYSPGGAMIAHSDLAYVIDGRGRTRDVLEADPGSGTDAMQSSFAASLAADLTSAASASS